MTIERRSDWPGPRRWAASTPGSAEQARAAPRSVREVDQVIATGYGSQGAFVSGPDDASTADGELRADQPEQLIGEHRGGRIRLLGAASTATASCLDYVDDSDVHDGGH